MLEASKLSEEEKKTIETNFNAKVSKFSEQQKSELEGLVNVLTENQKKEAAERVTKVIQLNKLIIQNKINKQ